MKAKGKAELDDFLLWCGNITQEEREEIMEFVNFGNKFEKGFNILMEYFDSISDEEKEKVDRKLKRLGL
jgi:hypothetical protein